MEQHFYIAARADKRSVILLCHRRGSRYQHIQAELVGSFHAYRHHTGYFPFPGAGKDGYVRLFRGAGPVVRIYLFNQRIAYILEWNALPREIWNLEGESLST